MANNQQELDANKVIDNLANQISSKAKDIAVMQSRMEYMQEVIDNQDSLLKEYENKSND